MPDFQLSSTSPEIGISCKPDEKNPAKAGFLLFLFALFFESDTIKK